MEVKLMRKKIIWIDDSVSRMTPVITNLFPRLWVKNITNEVLFYGDNYKNEGSELLIDDKTLDKFYDELNHRFRIFCFRRFESNKEIFPNDDNRTLEKIYEKYNEMRPKKPINLNEISSTIIEKISEIANGQNVFIGLDVQLNIDDEKLKKETQAMHLFYELSKIKNNDIPQFKVFLFSTDANKNNFIDDWFNKLKEIYNDFNPELKNIFDRNELVVNTTELEDKKESPVNITGHEERNELYRFLNIYIDGEKEDNDI